MAVNWHGPERNRDMMGAIGNGLARCAVFFQTQHKLRLNKSNPRPYDNSSSPGEYPRARTGFGRNGHVYEPTSPAAMAREGGVRLGYLMNAWYMAYLEIYKGRLGLVHTLNSIKAQLVSILKTSGAK